MGFFFVPNGMHMPDWTPSKEGAGYDLKPILERVVRIKNQSMCSPV